jgi:hypothetical protein
MICCEAVGAVDGSLSAALLPGVPRPAAANATHTIKILQFLVIPDPFDFGERTHLSPGNSFHELLESGQENAAKKKGRREKRGRTFFSSRSRYRLALRWRNDLEVSRCNQW